jgi:putative flippase GtrA
MRISAESKATVTRCPPKRAATFRELVRFAGVGIVSSIAYALVFIVLTKGLGLHPQLSNYPALIAAAIWSYFGHSRITFEYSGDRMSAAWRFAAQIAVFYLLSSAAYWLVERLGFDSIWGLAICVVLIPASSYLVMKLWTFARLTGD